MNGQWIGRFTGTNDGLLVVEFDDVGSHYEGSVYAINNDRTLPASYGELVVRKGQPAASVRVPLFLLDRGTGNTFTEEGLKKTHPGVTAAKYADAALTISEREIRLRWTTDISTHGQAIVNKSNGGEKTSLPSLVKSWDEFKSYATDLDRALSVSRSGEQQVEVAHRIS